MKTIIIAALLFTTTACTVDAFAPADSGTESDAAVQPDGSDSDASMPPDAAQPDSGTLDTGTDATQAKDGAADAVSDAQAPVCAPFGYKACAQPNVKCQVLNGQGDAVCAVPGTKAIGQACGGDQDCPTDSACEVSICRRLCQAVLNGPYGQAAWNTNGCGQCPGSTHYQNPRFPSWIGICTY